MSPRPSIVRSVAGLVLVVLPMSLSATTTSFGAPGDEPPDQDRVTVIVQLKGTTGLDVLADSKGARRPAQDQVADLRQNHREFVASARDQGIGLTKKADYTTVLDGMAVTADAHDVAALRARPDVLAVYPDTEYRTALADAVPQIRAPEVWSRVDPSGVPVKGARKTVAVIDTGIDYDHPDLGGCFGDGCRVVDGYDFVNNDSDPDDDNFHGTHVAGIIGAAGETTGIAPEVEFLAYKVLDRSGSGPLSAVLGGLDAATDPFNLDRPSVINMSLGSPDGDGTDLLSQSVQAATEAGFVVVTAAGNTGPDQQTIGSPASAPGALTVGASTTGVVTPQARLVAPKDYDLKTSRLGFSANPSEGTTELDVVDVGAGDAADYEGVAVAGKAVLVASGQTPFSWFQDGVTAEQHGAAAALIAVADPADPRIASAAGPVASDDWSVGPQVSGDDGRLDDLVALSLPASSATDLQGYLAAGPATLAITAADATDQVPAFSSRGPSGLIQTKPDLVAPGVEVRSTVPVGEFGGSYGRVSGTSMAAPMVAGAAILLQQLHPEWSGAEVAAALTGSARRLDDAGPLSQGAGLLDVAAAADSSVTASPRLVSFGLADVSDERIDRSAQVTLTNNGDTAVELDLDVVEDTGNDAADVTVRPANVRLLAGESRQVSVDAELRDPQQVLDVSGWVSADIDGEGRDDLSIPYALSVRPLDVFATPDPAIDGTEVFVQAPVTLASAPVVTVTGPRGYRRTLTTRHDHGPWWRVPVDAERAGSYQMRVSATATSAFGGARLRGGSTFEVLGEPKGKDPGWLSIGPTGSGGEMAVSSTRDDDMLVASERSTTMFSTTDAGETWLQRSNLPVAGGSGFGAQPVLAADPTDGDRYYLGIDAGFVDPTYQGALMVTDDAGESWQRLPYPDDRVFELAVGDDGRSLAVVSDDAFYVSTDRGQTWRTLWGDWDFATDVAIDGERVYLATADGLYAYGDLGGDLSGPELVYQPSDSFSYVEAVAAEGGQVFVWPSSSNDSIYHSTDGGATWAPAFKPTSTFMIGRDLSIVDGDVWATSDEAVWVGHDMGVDWSQSPTPLEGDWVGDVETFAGQKLLSARNGLFATGDAGASYERVGVSGLDVNQLVLMDTPAGRRLLAATTWDTYAADLRHDGLPADTDWGTSPVEGEFDEADGYFIESAGDAGVIYKVSDTAFGSFGVYRSTDAGATWALTKKSAQVPTSFAVHPADPNSLYVGFRNFTIDQGLLISHDGGTTWRRETFPREFLALAGDPRDASRIYAGALNGLYVSEDSGRHFTQLNDIPTTSIAVSPDDPDQIVFGGHRLYQSMDAGLSVGPASYAPFKLWVSDLAFGPDRKVYAATSSFYDEGLLKGGRGVLVSTDNGKSYRSMSKGLGGFDVLSLAVAPDGQLYAGLRGGGVYATD